MILTGIAALVAHLKRIQASAETLEEELAYIRKAKETDKPDPIADGFPLYYFTSQALAYIKKQEAIISGLQQIMGSK